MAKSDALADPKWVGLFLTALQTRGIATEAARAANVPIGAAKWRRDRDQDFADAWAEAVAQAPSRPKRAQPVSTRLGANAGKRINTAWRKDFLRALAETSCVKAAAEAAKVEPGRACRLRRTDAGFAANWQAALAEGYDHLEMETLAFLRGTDPTRKFDVLNAIRLLTAHRKTVAEFRAAQEPDDEQAVLASIDDLIDRMRREAATHDASKDGDGADDQQA